MKKYLSLMLVVISILFVIGCADEKTTTEESKTNSAQKAYATEGKVNTDSKNSFVFNGEELSNIKNLSKEYSDAKVSFLFPDSWIASGNSEEVSFELARTDSSANMNLIVEKSDKYFIKVTKEQFEKTYPKLLMEQGFSNVKMINVTKGKWQNADALFAEFTGNMEGVLIHLTQYIYDDGNDLIIFTFAAAEDEWQENLLTTRSIMASVKIVK